MAQHSTDLAAMNKTSVKFASWLVRVTNANSISYKYTDKRRKQEVTKHKFECCVVGRSESAYAHAVLKGTESEVATAKQTYTNDAVWEMSKVRQTRTNQEMGDISSAVKVSVDLKRSILAPGSEQDLEEDKKLAKAAVPPRTVAETSKITSTRHQDLLAIVTQVEPLRQTKRGNVLDITVMDASLDSPGVYAKVRVSVWGSEKQSGIAEGKPLVFFNLACKVDTDSKQFTSWEDSLLCDAPECDKKTDLVKKFDEMKNSTNAVMLTRFNPKASMDVSGPQSIAAIAFLHYSARNPDGKLPAVMQIMAATIEEPSGSVTCEGADHIWFVTKIREFSGAAEVWMPERVALGLTGLDRAAFMDAHAAGSLQFPLLCNLRVSRSVSERQPIEPHYRTWVNNVVQEAKPIEWTRNMAPNKAYDNVLHMLNKLPGNEEGLIFGFLADIAPDPHTGFHLLFDDGSISKGAAVAVLIASRKKNDSPAIFGTGFKVSSPDVLDVANPVEQTNQTFNVSGYCTLNDMSRFDLSPPRGHAQRYAVALITSCEQNPNQPGIKNFHLEKVQMLEQAEGPQAKGIFQRLRRLTMNLRPSSTEEPRQTLAIEEEPKRPLKKCRTLSAMPTDGSLEDPPPR